MRARAREKQKKKIIIPFSFAVSIIFYIFAGRIKMDTAKVLRKDEALNLVRRYKEVIAPRFNG